MASSFDELRTDAPVMMYIIQRVYNDLPTNKDWLDPNLEVEMKRLVEKHC
jgi:hypothetical protein